MENAPLNTTSFDDPNDHGFSIVGIGASAGGVQTLKEFFKHVPENSGMAYVVILHLSPDHDSKLAQILQTVAKIPVRKVSSTVTVKPDHVYVIPPSKHLTMIDGKLKVQQNVHFEDRRAPVDIFFRTLADTHMNRAICIVLSGTGANGSMGLKRIKEKGGLVIAQDPKEAIFDDMPLNAIATHMVDEILPVAEIPQKIIQYKDNFEARRVFIDEEQPPADLEKWLHEIFAQLRMHTGHDFSNYKRPTLLRRIERRINIFNLPNLASYVEHLEQHKEEVHLLLKDIIISVTNFFRDGAAFDKLKEKVLPELFAGKTSRHQVRIWVAGCATGEEAYSIGIICAELLQSVADAPQVQIFATDIDDAAIGTAREGYYSLNDVADVSPERLQRFFNKDEQGFHIRREIREMILFAKHNFIRNPPFSRLDLVTCRNVLIYFNKIAQQQAVQTFHFSLNPNGYLFTGLSESAEGIGDLFKRYDRQHHIFQSQKKMIRSSPAISTSVSLEIPELQPIEKIKPAFRPDHSYGNLHQRLLEAYAPPSLVIDEAYDIVHLTDKASRYMQIKGGEPSQNLLKLIRPELRIELRSALYKAVQQRTPVETRGVTVSINEAGELINIHVRPVLSSDPNTKGYLLVLFEPTVNEEQKDKLLLVNDEPVIQQLEEEILRMKEQLKMTLEQHEYNAEELKASNEELQAMNEELRSSAEELETSKEELQSVNEEMITVNQELKVKIEETSMYSNNLQNLINSSSIGTIFLDRTFRIVLFTPAACDIFNLIPADSGRLLSHITHKLNYNDIISDAELVLARLQTIEREVTTTGNITYIMRLLPYRTAEDQVNGVVITFVDITERKKTEQKIGHDLADTDLLRDMGARLFAEGNTEVLYNDVLSAAIKLTRADAGIIQKFDEESNEFVLLAGQGLSSKIKGFLKNITTSFNSFPGKAFVSGKRLFMNFDVTKGNEPETFTGIMARGGYFTAQSTPLISRTGKVIGIVSTYWKEKKIKAENDLYFLDMLARQAADIIEVKQAEENIRISEERYRVALQAAEMGAWDWNVTRNIMEWNEQYFVMLGVQRGNEEKDSGYFLSFVHAEDKKMVKQKLQEAVDTAGVFHLQFRIKRNDNGNIRWVSGYGRTVEEKNGKAARIVGVLYDVTQSKELEQQKDEFIGIASHELKTPVTSIKGYADLLKEILADSNDKEIVDFTNKLGQQVERLNVLVRILLDTTKIAQGQLPLKTEPLDLNEMTAEHAKDQQQFTTRHHIIFMPGAIAKINGDRERLNQVISNLVSNAVKYSPNGGEVLIKTEPVENGIKLSVQDHGIGIPEHMKDKVFDRFFRASMAGLQTFPGLGLGLYITANIIKQHGGTIGVESSEGRGSLFYFILPAVS